MVELFEAPIVNGISSFADVAYIFLGFSTGFYLTLAGTFTIENIVGLAGSRCTATSNRILHSSYDFFSYMAMYIDSDFSEIEKMLMMIVNFMLLINSGLDQGCGGSFDSHGFFADDEETTFR